MPTEEYLTSYLDAWNRHDVDAVMAKLLENYPNARWKEGELFASGSRGGSEWLLLATSAKDG